MKPTRQRWVRIAELPKTQTGKSEESRQRYDVAVAAISAVHKIGKTVRVEKAQFGETLYFYARRG